ncbi:MAG: hypothetical protein E7525_05245 [Ruminococcaceae bacterium]|nr:hypothetical protein [Oscillospiraceae bacterium]
MYIELVRQFDKRKKTIWQDFLKCAGLSCDEGAKETVLLWEDDCIIGTGSGCGCCGSVLCSCVLQQMEQGNLKKILVCATGALMSTTSTQQGESIPSIAHLVHLSVE